MNIVYCHLDYSLTNFQVDPFSFNQLPEYALDSIKQSRFYNESSDIFLICNLKNIPDEMMKVLKNLNVKIVEQDFLLSDKIKKIAVAYSNLNVDRNLANFNFVGIIRYAFVEELMRKKQLNDVFYLEYDNLIYVDLNSIEKFFNRDCIFHEQSNIGLCAGTAFFRNVETLSRLNDEILAVLEENKEKRNIVYFNDQVILSKIRYSTDIISYFEDFSINGVKYIFDPADFGQFLGGTNVGHPPGFMNRGNRLYDFISENKDRMSFFKNKTGLFMELDGIFHKFVNLHVHNKSAIVNFITYESKRKNAIVYAVDGNQRQNIYLRYSIDSLKNCKSTVPIFILTTKDNQFVSLFENCNVVFVDDLLEKYRINEVKMTKRLDISRITFARLLIPIIDELKEYDRLLYLDADTEITKNIDDIFSLNFGDETEALAVCESLVSEHFDRLSKIAEKHSFSIKNKNLKTHYGNAGVTLFDNSKLRKSDYENRIVEMFRLQEICDFNNKDQDLLNVCFEVGVMPKKYNVFLDELDKVEDIRILHYTCHYKHILNRKVAAKYG